MSKKMPTAISGSFGKKLRLAREKSGKTMKDVAAALGVSLVYVSDMELGRRNPPDNGKLAVIAETIGLDRGLLRSWACEDRERAILDIAGRDRIIRRLALALEARWETISPAEAEAILSILKGD